SIPLTEKLTIGDECVNGWLAPPEGVLRFPVEVEENSRFSCRIGIAFSLPRSMTRPRLPHEMPGGHPEDFEPLPPHLSRPVLPPRLDNIKLSIEFFPENSDGSISPTVIFQLPPDKVPDLEHNWYDVNVSLDNIAPAKGELKFFASGPAFGNPNLQILWGQPVIYTPLDEPRRNVLLIGIDTLRSDALSPYGARPEVTPNLTKFSESATLFEQARSQAPWTLPSFASIVTGLMPTKAGATGTHRSIPEKTTTAGEMLLPLGYATFTVCSTPWIGGPTSGFQQGVETTVFLPEHRAQIQVERAKRFITESIDRDWFCFIHIMDPHEPYEPPEEYRKILCDPDYSGIFPTGHVGGDIRLEPGVVSVEEEIRHVRNLYDAEVANVDAAMSDLFRFLDENGLMDDTLIIFCSDHGEEFYEHDGFGHGFTQYDELVHVPLIVKGGDFPEGHRISKPVANLDILPTILSYLDIEKPDDLPGFPLQDTVHSPESIPERIIFGEETARQKGIPLIYSFEWPFKCIFNVANFDVELYHVENDPSELSDIRTEYPDQLASLIMNIAAFIRPQNSAYHLMVAMNPMHSPRIFSGTLKIPGGIEYVEPYFLDSSDTYFQNGDTLQFAISTNIDLTVQEDTEMIRNIPLTVMPVKHLVIIPSPDADYMEINVSIDEESDSDWFFPYGTNQPEALHNVTVHLDSFPLTPYLPQPESHFPSSLYIWGIRGLENFMDTHELDPETIEQLRALGYIDD
ncbi:MAG TPA: DUF229 domain-containing protein, partial [Firmicutes bacterium]|nr:DUF229 domain-containing protein [Bacillota bacterium]